MLALLRPEAAVFCTHRLAAAVAMVFCTVAGPGSYSWRLCIGVLSHLMPSNKSCNAETS